MSAVERKVFHPGRFRNTQVTTEELIRLLDHMEQELNATVDVINSLLDAKPDKVDLVDAAFRSKS